MARETASELERRLARAQRELSEALERQAATEEAPPEGPLHDDTPIRAACL
jgi:hypothetical protein